MIHALNTGRNILACSGFSTIFSTHTFHFCISPLPRLLIARLSDSLQPSQARPASIALTRHTRSVITTSLMFSLTLTPRLASSLLTLSNLFTRTYSLDTSILYLVFSFYHHLHLFLELSFIAVKFLQPALSTTFQQPLSSLPSLHHTFHKCASLLCSAVLAGTA